jgi:hypoxanthine phosphoribosyltransferase
LKSKGVDLKAKPFELLLRQDQITARIRDLGRRISTDYAGKNPIFLGVLKGSFIFMADLVRAVNIPAEVEFISAHSYGAGVEPGDLMLSGGSDTSLRGRHILLVEGIVDTGHTAGSIIQALKRMEPASVEIVTLLNKTARREIQVPIKYSGFDVGEDFVIGFGLDHGQMYRTLPFIGKVIEKKRK